MFACSAYNKTKLFYDWSHLVWSACKSVISHLDYWRSFLHLKKRNSLKTPINFVRMVKLYINSYCTCLFTLGSILQSHVASSWTWSCWFLYFRIMLTQTTHMDQYRVLGAEDGSCEAYCHVCWLCCTVVMKGFYRFFIFLYFWKTFACIYLAALGLGCSTWGLRSSLRHAGSLFAAFPLSVVACGIQFPDQGSNPGPFVLGAQSLSHWTNKKGFFARFTIKFFFCFDIESLFPVNWSLPNWSFWWQMIKMCCKFKYNQEMVLRLQKDKPKSTINMTERHKLGAIFATFIMNNWHPENTKNFKRNKNAIPSKEKWEENMV